jgi:hypothetical protein
MPLAREINQGIQAVQVQSQQAAEHSSEWGRAGAARRLGAAAAPMRGLLLHKAHNWWVRTVCITNLLISLLHCILTCPAAPAAPPPTPSPLCSRRAAGSAGGAVPAVQPGVLLPAGRLPAAAHRNAGSPPLNASQVAL